MKTEEKTIAEAMSDGNQIAEDAIDEAQAFEDIVNESTTPFKSIYQDIGKLHILQNRRFRYMEAHLRLYLVIVNEGLLQDEYEG